MKRAKSKSDGGQPVKYRISRKSIRLVDATVSRPTLTRQQYSEVTEDPLKLVAKKTEEEMVRINAWMLKAVDITRHCTTVMTVLAAILTGCCSYIFIQLPSPIYSKHVLFELLLIRDFVIHANNFEMPIGVRAVAPLPLVVFLMYLYNLYNIYIIYYPNLKRPLLYLRYGMVIIAELYFLLSLAVFIRSFFYVEDRLNTFHEYDRGGIQGKYTHTHIFNPDAPPNPLHFLHHSQEYFHCCGFRSRFEWRNVYPKLYGNTFPISCCDAEGSGVSCYEPVKELVTYKRRSEAPNRTVETITKPRLFQRTCYNWERNLIFVVLSIVTGVTFLYLVLATFNAYLILRVMYYIGHKNFELTIPRRHPEYF